MRPLNQKQVTSNHLDIRSVTDLSPLCEHFTVNEETGDLEFSHSSFGYTSTDLTLYFGRSSCRKYHLTPQALSECMVEVPDQDVYPEALPHYTYVAHRRGFFKGPMLTAYDELKGTQQVAGMLRQEVEVCEQLQAHPHPNVIRYYGCSERSGRVVGLLFERYPLTLEQYLSDHKDELDLELGFKRIRDGVHHLHTLSLAHNDIKPQNIMVTANGTWVLIDLGSCLPFGANLTSAGTSGWYDDSWTTSEPHHDEIALDKLWTWLESFLVTSTSSNQNLPGGISSSQLPS
ncbi:kinase-like protein [Teratosphaeria destructans]|uniref:Kinase-like protein n=1 Tax=Teratosphaeria destructans TaxID=418781 RepID=A0A9W7SZW0_9PEZI|nr:kinase-like protein [Teratosphaeria destructans]